VYPGEGRSTPAVKEEAVWFGWMQGCLCGAAVSHAGHLHWISGLQLHLFIREESAGEDPFVPPPVVLFTTGRSRICLCVFGDGQSYIRFSPSV